MAYSEILKINNVGEEENSLRPCITNTALLFPSPATH